MLDVDLANSPSPTFLSLFPPPPSVNKLEDFGFKHLLWVYSGRRGVHCWVCDQEAIQLSQEARSAIVEYLTLVKGGEQQSQKVKLRPPPHPQHPSVKYAYYVQICECDVHVSLSVVNVIVLVQCIYTVCIL